MYSNTVAWAKLCGSKVTVRVCVFTCTFVSLCAWVCLSSYLGVPCEYTQSAFFRSPSQDKSCSQCESETCWRFPLLVYCIYTLCAYVNMAIVDVVEIEWRTNHPSCADFSQISFHVKAVSTHNYIYMFLYTLVGWLTCLCVTELCAVYPSCSACGHCKVTLEVCGAQSLMARLSSVDQRIARWGWVVHTCAAALLCVIVWELDWEEGESGFGEWALVMLVLLSTCRCGTLTLVNVFTYYKVTPLLWDVSLCMEIKVSFADWMVDNLEHNSFVTTTIVHYHVLSLSL